MLLAIALGAVFAIHVFVLRSLGHPMFDHLIVRSYGVNFMLAVVIYAVLYRFRLKLKNQIGFLFMAGSFLKFALFFLIFYPVYKADGVMQRSEFAAFFIPYAVSLVLETYFTSKMLQDLENSED
ncbi:DUF6168 family protein [Flagellimonas sp. DF-77]|uniref:DUF6168 family protein n=1 Tax=Flagellimonas algarum TaxID=3230298 RepID=UPI00339A393D